MLTCGDKQDETCSRPGLQQSPPFTRAGGLRSMAADPAQCALVRLCGAPAKAACAFALRSNCLAMFPQTRSHKE